MIKSLVVAAVVSLGLAGYAVAQETTTGAPAGTASVNHEPPGPVGTSITTTFTITTGTTITTKWLQLRKPRPLRLPRNKQTYAGHVG